MQIGFNEATMMGSSTLEQDLRLCEQAGFDYIEMRLDMLAQYLKSYTVGDLRAFFKNSRLKPHAMNAFYTYTNMFAADADKQKRVQHMESFLFGCRVAEEIGCHDFVVVPPINQHFLGGTQEEIFRDCVRSLTRLSDIAHEYGVRLSFELVGSPSCSVRTIVFAKQIVEAVNRENVGYALDSANIYSYKKLNDFAEIKTVEASKIFAVHINDYDDVPEAELTKERRCFCGEGVIDLENYLGCIKATGYTGMVSIETFRPSYWALQPWEGIKEAYATTRAILEKYGCLDALSTI